MLRSCVARAVLTVAALTDEVLCQSWQSSYTALQHQFTAAQMAKTVAERQATWTSSNDATRVHSRPGSHRGLGCRATRAPT